MNATDSQLAMLRADLPHAPDEVLNEWLIHYADMLGWPPTPDRYSLPTGIWLGILSQRPIAFWAQVRRQKKASPLEFTDIDQESQQALFGIRDAHVYGIRNAYSDISDGRQRTSSIMAHVHQHGSVPAVLVFLAVGSQLSVIDGHHRLVVYFLNRDPKFRQMLPNGAAQFDPTLHKWIGRYYEDAT